MKSVVLVGPLSPQDVSDLLTGRDKRHAEQLQGYRGIPVSELARALLGRGVEVQAVTTSTEVDEPLTFDGDNFRLSVQPARPRARHRALDLFRQERKGLAKAIRESDAPVIHAHWTYEFAWAAEGAGRPVVVTAHDAPLTILRHIHDPYRTLRTIMAYRVRLKVRHLTAVSPYLAKQWRRQMLYRRPIAIVPNIAPTLAPARKQEVSERRLVIDVADAGSRKNVDILIEAFAHVHRAFPDATLALIGHGLGERDPVAGRVGAYPPGTVQLLGPVDRATVAAKLAEAAVFAHPSLEECCSMAVLEAMNANVPVVAGLRSGGTPWILEGGRAGVLVDERDPQSLARGITQLLADPQYSAELSVKAAARISAVFSPEAVVNAYLDCYERAIWANRDPVTGNP